MSHYDVAKIPMTNNVCKNYVTLNKIFLASQTQLANISNGSIKNNDIELILCQDNL